MADCIRDSDVIALFRELARARKARGDIAGATSANQSVYTLRVSGAVRTRSTDTLAKRVERITKVTRPATLPPVPASRLMVRGDDTGVVSVYSSIR